MIKLYHRWREQRSGAKHWEPAKGAPFFYYHPMLWGGSDIHTVGVAGNYGQDFDKKLLANDNYFKTRDEVLNLGPETKEHIVGAMGYKSWEDGFEL